jgi:hypothetical protein
MHRARGGLDPSARRVCRFNQASVKHRPHHGGAPLQDMRNSYEFADLARIH